MIRDYLGYDQPFIRRMEIQCYENPWSVEEIHKNFQRIFVGLNGFNAISYAIYDIQRMSILLLRLGVNPLFRRKGHGSDLIEYMVHMMRGYRKITTIVPESNLAAENFLKKNRFKCVNVLKNHFSVCGEHEDGYYFVRKL